jgi:hypothetical protein
MPGGLASPTPILQLMSGYVYFYVDESGHTGPNLFDPAQPVLYYGVLSSPRNVDALALPDVLRLRNAFGVERLHASELQAEQFEALGPSLSSLQKRLDLRFDIYEVHKRDHAIIAFFDQIFDCHMNPAVAWHHYWTPMRYFLLLNLATLFDEALGRKAWEARISLDGATAVAEICQTLIDRLPGLRDARTRSVLGQALRWAADHPAALSYNAGSGAAAKSIMPNVIGFQSVMFRIAGRVRTLKPSKVSITVDRQSQFNPAQRSLAEVYGRARGNTLPMGPGMPIVDFRGMPDCPITIAGGADSPGLEITDVCLWAFRRAVEGRDVPDALAPVCKRLSSRTDTDEVSLRALEKRWGDHFSAMPEPTEEQLAKARALLELAEQRRRDAMRAADGRKTD